MKEQICTNKWYELLRINSHKVFIAENVKGLMTLHKGEIFKRIYKAFEDVGYTLSYRLLNAADYARSAEARADDYGWV
ncbi:MAG: DNA cytosine methyltransferase [Lachnospiraceae bacterium]